MGSTVFTVYALMRGKHGYVVFRINFQSLWWLVLMCPLVSISGLWSYLSVMNVTQGTHSITHNNHNVSVRLYNLTNLEKILNQNFIFILFNLFWNTPSFISVISLILFRIVDLITLQATCLSSKNQSIY